MDFPSTGLSEQHNWLGATRGIRKLVDEAQISALQARDFTIKNEEWEETFELTEREITADKFGLLGPRLALLAADAKYHPDQLMGELMENGFDSTGIDYTGSQFFDTNKKAFADAKPFTNVGTAKLSSDAYSAAKTNLRGRTNAAGRPLNLGRDLRLICSAKNEDTGLQILQAENIFKTSQNAGDTARAAAAVTNVNKGTAKLTVWPELDARGMEDAWFLADWGAPMKPFIQQTLKPWSYYTLDNPGSEYVLRFHKFLYQIYKAGNVGYGFPETIYGSDGSAN